MWPRRARSPTSPPPAGTGRRSSPRTDIASMALKRGPASGSGCDPLAPSSDAPMVSIISAFGRCSRSLALTAEEKTAPPEPTDTTADRPYAFSSSASPSGRAMASPTTMTVIALLLGQPPGRVRIESVRRVEHDRAAAEQHDAHPPLGGAVHDRCEHE